MTYDNLGRTASLTDPDGSGFLSASTTHYYYDFLDRIISKQDANSSTTSYTYDGEGDTRGHTTLMTKGCEAKFALVLGSMAEDYGNLSASIRLSLILLE